MRMKFWSSDSPAVPVPRPEVRIEFRTLSLRPETLEEEKQAKRNDDPTSLIGQIDIYLAPTNDVFTRFGTSPTIGLESSALQRRAKDGKNTISNPPTHYVNETLRLEVSSDLKFDRSLLPGESDMVPGEVQSTSDNALECHNLALTSTFVVQGACTGVVFAIGDKSVMGVLVAMSGTTKFKLTTVQREVWFFTKIVSGFALMLFSISIIVWAAWLRRKFPGFEDASTATINSIGCLTAFVPQGLLVCVALSLTIIAKRMAKRNVLIKNLATIETLGCMSVLCSDKTGTLTLGSMTVNAIAFADEQFHVDSQ